MTELSELFARDPLELAKNQAELDELIDKLRGMRTQFINENKSAKVTPKKVAAKSTTLGAAGISFDMSLLKPKAKP